MLRILNFGAGVQSSCILLRSCLGELPKIDHAIFADTGDEPSWVNEWIPRAKQIAEDAGITFHIVHREKLSDHLKQRILAGRRLETIPAFTSPEKGTRAAPLRRNCTREFKIKLINRRVKEILGLKPRGRWPKVLTCESWIGISVDEEQRMKVSPFAWQRFRHPLIEGEWPDADVIRPPRLAKPWTRVDCESWLVSHGYTGIGRSACKYCPMHGGAEWKELASRDPAGFEDACAIDRLLRSGPGGVIHGMRQQAFLHRSLQPLETRPFADEESEWADECAGVCGV
jgi:hypothetical protein